MIDTNILKDACSVRDNLSDVESFLAGYIEGRGAEQSFIQESHIGAVTDAINTYIDLINRGSCKLSEYKAGSEVL
jgi:hypothetical protein